MSCGFSHVDIFHEATGLLAFTAEASLGEVQTFVGSLEPRALDIIDAEVIVETGIHAAFNGAVSVTAACDAVLQRKGKSMPPKTRVLCQVLSAILLVAMPTTHTGGKISSRQRQSMLLARRVEGMKALERALLASKRQQDPQLVERVCIYAWNLSLPLLQPHLRSHLARVLGLSSSVLEELDSLLLGFRARLYLEIAKLEVASDFLAKANANVSKALALDYGTVTRSSDASALTVELLSAHEDWIARPVDTHLLPMKQKLDLKLAAEISHSRSSEVLAMLEQVKEGKDPHKQQSTLVRCIEMMTEMSNLVESPAAADHVRLWGEISALAWQRLRDGELARKATETALATYFPSTDTGEDATPKSISGEKSLRILEVDLRLLLVEVLAAKLKDRAAQVNTVSLQSETSGSRIEQQGGHRSAERPSSIDMAALVSLGQEAYVLGMHRSRVDGGVSQPADPATEHLEADEDALLHALEEELKGIKGAILKHLTRALKAATRIGWTFVLENTCIYLWNYHFHIFRMLLESARMSNSSSDAFDPQWILSECVSAFEAVYAALEAVPTGVDSTLLASVGLGLSSVYEKTGRLDKALAIADTFLKRKASAGSAVTALVDSTPTNIGVLHLKRFAELKSRVQIAQNAKDIVPTDSTTAQVKVVAYLEAMEVTFRQLLLPGVQQSQVLEKAQGFYQKAVAMWQTSAPEIFNALMSDELDRVLEDEQQLMELYVEIWVRVGCGAFRLRNTKYAIECAEQALLALRPGEGKKAKQIPQLLGVGGTWKWFALAELLYGRSILALGQGDALAQKLLLASLTHLVRAIEYGLRGNISTLVIRACEVIWNATIAAIQRSNADDDDSEVDNFLELVVEKLRKTLRYLDQVITAPDADLSFYGEMVLLTLAVCEKASKWSDQYEICEAVLKAFSPTSHRAPLPSDIMKEIQTAAAISGAHLGKPSSLPKSGGSAKSPDQLQEALVQAQILKKVAFSSWKDPPAQLRALSNAYIELDGQAEEQALVLVDIAEWLFTNHLPSPCAEAYLECATSALLSCQKLKLQASQATLSRRTSTRQVSVPSRQKSNVAYSPLWFAEKQLRIFVMSATLSRTCTERSKQVRLALYHVEQAWEHIILVANEIELQATFDREAADPASKGASGDFDEWKKDKRPKFTKPASEQEWLYFFLEHEQSASERFCLPWVKALQSVQSPNTLHVTQAVLTLAYLEDLMAMLRDDGLQYLSMVSSLCLYTVLFHAYIPQRSYIAQVWLELTQFELMERLNLSSFSLPLQSALDMVQTRGETLIKELQEAEVSGALRESDLVSRKRRIFHSDHLDARAKAVASTELLLNFGFVRQAKTIFEILRYTAESSRPSGDNNAGGTELSCECEVLSSRISEVEGQSEWAFVRMKAALESPALDVCRFLRWTLRCCKLNPDHEQALRELQHAEKRAARTVLAGMRRPAVQRPGTSTRAPYLAGAATSSPPDIEVVQLMARVAFKQATLLLKKASASVASSALELLRESKRALDKSLRTLALIEADYICSALLLKYDRALRSCEGQHTDNPSDAGLDSQSILHEVLTLQESCLARQAGPFASSRLLGTDKHQQEAVVTPLRLKVALTKMQVARLLVAPEISAAAIKERDMSWYRYYEDSQRSVVDKWLNTTGAGLENISSSDLPRAMTLLNASIELLGGNPTLEIQHALAQVLRLQCRRLALFHGDDRQKADAIRNHLWTRYTSSDAPQATWVCCHGARAELAAAATDAASASQSAVQPPSQPPAHADEEDSEDLEADGVDQSLLDQTLAAHAAQLQKYQIVAFEKQCAELLRLCSSELIQVLGCRHAFDCAKNVLKHQSAEVIEVAATLFEQCVAEANVQRLHLRRMRKLQKTHTSAAAHSLPFQLSQLYLSQQSEAFKRMSVGIRVDSIVAALPSSIRVLCLHFSPDRCFLYAALLGSTERRVAIARMEFIDTQTALLKQLQKRMQAWRSKCEKEALAYDDAHGQDETYEFTSAESQGGALPVSHGEDALEDEFTSIVNDTIELFSPLFTHSAMTAELKNNLAGNTLVLLLDRVLACLPVEALPALQPADAIARDFSIQMLHQRLMAMKKQPLRPNEIRVIVDPHREDPGNPSGQTMASVVKHAGGTWKDAFEHGHIPSVTDWQQALLARRGGGLLYVGPNRVLGSYLPLQQVTGMNVASTCQAILLLDHAENAKSARRQSKLDSEKSAWEREIERDPYARALLLTLCGVNVLTVNQWTTTFNSNRRMANGLLKNLYKGYNVGKALKKLSQTTIAATASASATSLPPDAAAAPTSLPPASDGAPGGKLQLKNRFRYNAVVYGLAHVTLKSSE
jgi:tetratricopeptide (TPR) repeat protein